jgi:hypothetical protein
MNSLRNHRTSERGSAGLKVLLVFLGLFLVGHGLWNYVPVAYNGASFKQEMDTAVVKALAASGQIKPMDAAAATVTKAAHDYGIPADAIIEVKPVGGVVQVYASYTQPVNILPLGLFKYNYKFDYTARPVGYLLKDSK